MRNLDNGFYTCEYDLVYIEEGNKQSILNSQLDIHIISFNLIFT